MACSGGALAQTPPDAGALRKQIEQPQNLPVLPAQPAPATPGEPVTAAPGGTQVLVQRFEFTGNRVMATDALEKAVEPWKGRSLDFAGLQAAAAAVGDAYRQQGWLVRTQLPRQEIVDGVVRIEIVEAQPGRVAVEAGAAGRVPSAQVEAVVRGPLQDGAPLRLADVDRGLMLADDLPGVVVAGRLQAGRAPGETDIALTVADEPLVMGEATVDNFGGRSTGALRLSTNVVLASPLGFGDLASAALIHTRGSDYARAGYTVPLGSDGLRVGVDGSVFRYRLVGDDFDALNARGRSSSVGLNAVYPLVRSRERNLYLGAALERRSFDNYANGAAFSRYEVDGLTLSANANAFDGFGGGGANALSLALVGTRVDLGGADDAQHAAADAAGPRVRGGSGKLRFAASRQQVLTPSLSLFMATSGQFTGRNQDSSEKFYLGGPYGVRAYPVGEAGGSKGVMANIELRQKLSDGLVATAFYDWGQVSTNADNGFTGAPARNRYSLQGAGLGVAWQGPRDLLIKTTWARRIGRNPNPTASGQDQDGSLVRNRFWLSASLPF
ncbi:hypothetical protein ASF44_10655 [Pseudorhodoferax sp. Leaf274]|nr:hypothetical protein ASF44_10655 [Pseudorhodoferax sp. Leaf274]